MEKKQQDVYKKAVNPIDEFVRGLTRNSSKRRSIKRFLGKVVKLIGLMALFSPKERRSFAVTLIEQELQRNGITVDRAIIEELVKKL